ncbi:MAG: transcriptional regulator [Hyphomicrobiales bacterium]|nr:MAG: transcriptional regulator [Hyphomicrobiales bacterium]
MEPIHSKLARAALNLGLREVSADLGISTATITRFEKAGDSRISTLKLLQDYYEGKGVILIHADETAGLGVRLKTPSTG